MYGDTDDCKARCGMMNFLIGLSERAARCRDPNFAQDLSWLKGRRQQIDKELVRLDNPFASWTDSHHLRLQSNNRRGPIAGWIRVSQAAANGAFVSHLDISDAGRAGRQQWTDL